MDRHHTLGANAEFYGKFAPNARAWYARAQEAVPFMVVERYRQPGEVDALEWYDAAGNLEFRGEFLVMNIEEDLVKVQAAWKDWSQRRDRRTPAVWRAEADASTQHGRSRDRPGQL